MAPRSGRAPRYAAAVALLAAGCAAAPAPRTDPLVEDVLADLRLVLGTEGLLSARDGLVARGTRSEPAGDVPFTLAFDARGRFAHGYGGPAPRAEGDDGIDTWAQDPSGFVRRIGLGARAHARADAWLRSGLWLDPWRPPFDVELDAERTDGDVVALALRSVDGPLTAVVLVDRRDRVPVAFELTRHGRARRVRLEDWRTVDGFRLPHRFVEEHARGEAVETIEELGVATDASFVPPRPRARDAFFSPAASPHVDTRRGRGGRLYVRPRAGEDPLGWFLVDSGFGASAGTRERADALGWRTAGATGLAGVGGRGAGAWRVGERLDLGPLSWLAPRLVEVDLDFVSERAGFEVDGVLGADVMARCVLVLDGTVPAVEVHDPARYLRRELPWQTALLDGTAACVAARFDGERTGWVRIDSGSEDTLTVAPWAVREWDLAVSRADMEPVRLSGGFGGLVGFRGSIRALTLGGLTFEHVPATFLRRDEAAGAFDDPWVAGNLGIGVLGVARVVLDLGRERASFSTGP